VLKAVKRPPWDGAKTDLHKLRLSTEEQILKKVSHTSRNNLKARLSLDEKGIIFMDEQDEVFDQILGPKPELLSPSHRLPQSKQLEEEVLATTKNRNPAEPSQEIEDVYLGLLTQVHNFEIQSGRFNHMEVINEGQYNDLTSFSTATIQTLAKCCIYLSETAEQLSREKSLRKTLQEAEKKYEDRIKELEMKLENLKVENIAQKSYLAAQEQNSFVQKQRPYFEVDDSSVNPEPFLTHKPTRTVKLNSSQKNSRRYLLLSKCDDMAANKVSPKIKTIANSLCLPPAVTIQTR